MRLLMIAWTIFLGAMALNSLDDGSPVLLTNPSQAGLPGFMQPIAR